MKMAVLHINPCRRDSIATTAQIAQYVSDNLKIPFIHNEATARKYQDDYDILFVAYGILLFCDYRDIILDIHKRAKRIIKLENDYMMEPDYRLKRDMEIWGTIPHRIKRFGGRYINWCKLTWRNGVPLKRPSKTGLFYFGKYREQRHNSFEKYFNCIPYQLHISTYPKNREKFLQFNNGIHFYAPFKKHIQLRAFSWTIYIEDDYSYKNYTSIANRFYECLFTGVPILFDKECVKSFSKAEINIEEFLVNDKMDVQHFMNHYDRQMAVKRQRELWYRDYTKDVDIEFKKACIAEGIYV